MRRTIADPRFAARLRELRTARGMSLRDLHQTAHVSKSTLSELENGATTPMPDTAAALDRALAAGGELAGMVAEVEQPQRWETAELLARLRTSDVSTPTVEALHATAFELCCAYGWQDALLLRGEALGWLAEVRRLLHRQVGLAQHRELLTAAGWLALLTGCLEYDLGMRADAEATRRAALELATEAGHGEIAAWAWEMSAWFALTQGRHREVVTAAEAGQQAVGDHTAAVQLLGQQAKALARLGDVDGVHAALARGRRLLDRFSRPDRPDHHFVVDPDKWDFYAMDAYRIVGQDDHAEHHAEQVLALGTAADGTERAPMRMAEARLTLGKVAARRGELDQAVAVATAAFAARRRSLPVLRMVAAEVDEELARRDPRGRITAEWGEAVRSVSAD